MHDTTIDFATQDVHVFHTEIHRILEAILQPEICLLRACAAVGTLLVEIFCAVDKMT